MTKSNKIYEVYGRIRADIEFNELIRASSEDDAVYKIEKKILKKYAIKEASIIDQEIYCEET